MSGWAVSAQPRSYTCRVAHDLGGRIADVDLKRTVDRLMTDAKPKDEAAVREVAHEGSGLGTEVRVSQIDVGDPRADLDALGCAADDLRCGQRIVVHLSDKDGVETRCLRLSRNVPYLSYSPAGSRNHAQSRPLTHTRSLVVSDSVHSASSTVELSTTVPGATAAELPTVGYGGWRSSLAGLSLTCRWSRRET